VVVLLRGDLARSGALRIVAISANGSRKLLAGDNFPGRQAFAPSTHDAKMRVAKNRLESHPEICAGQNRA